MKNPLPIALIVCATWSCATPVHSLSEGGRNVELVDYIEPARRNKIQELGLAKCSLGMNFRSQESNIEACQSKLRNDAAAMGGNLVLVEPRDQSIGKSINNPISGESIHDTNKVDLRGIVYRYRP